MAKAEQVQTGFAQVNGVRLYYEVAGSGHPLVLIHGGLVDSRLWDDQFSTFAQRYRVIRYDMRGFGQSASEPAQQSYAPHADLAALLKFLAVDKIYVLGLSMGGGIAIDFTLAYPQMVDALIAVAAGVSGNKPSETVLHQWAEIDEAYRKGDLEHAADLSLRMWTDGPNRTPDQVASDVRKRIKAMTLHNYSLPDDPAQSIELDPPALARLSEIHAPTLVIVGDQDIAGIRTIAERLVTEIPGAKKVIIPNAAHHPNMEHPAVFNAAVLDFLSEVSNGRK